LGRLNTTNILLPADASPTSSHPSAPSLLSPSVNLGTWFGSGSSVLV
jgi:hypothetical protein